MNYLPTVSAPLPYRGAPLTAQDIILQQVNFEDRIMERTRMHESVVPPSKRMTLPKFKLTETAKVAFGAQVHRFAVSLIKI
jgi:hypothetical protein